MEPVPKRIEEVVEMAFVSGVIEVTTAVDEVVALVGAFAGEDETRLEKGLEE